MTHAIFINIDRDDVYLDLLLSVDVEQTTLEHAGGVTDITVLATFGSQVHGDDVGLETVRELVGTTYAEEVAEAVHDALEADR